MAQSSEATRSSVVEASAREQTFFKKLSGGFSAVQDSVASLEELTEEVSSNLGILDTPKSAKKEKKQKQTTITSNDAFFAPESAILANFTSVYVSSIFYLFWFFFINFFCRKRQLNFMKHWPPVQWTLIHSKVVF